MPTTEPTFSVYRQGDDVYLTIDDGRRVCQHKLRPPTAESMAVALHAAGDQPLAPIDAAAEVR